MTSRRRVGNTGNSTPVEKKIYELRGRTINGLERSPYSPSVSTITYSETNPQTPEPGSKDISDIVRPEIKSAAKEKDSSLELSAKSKSTRRTVRLEKDSTLELSAKGKSTRRTVRLAIPDMEDNSNDGSDYGKSSRSGLSENDRQSHVTTTVSSFTRSAKGQPNPLPDDNPTSFLGRPPISGASGKSQASQQPEYTRDESKYGTRETWRERTKAGKSHSSSEDEEETSHKEKQEYTRKDEWKETTYIEERQTRRKHTEVPPVRTGTRVGFSDVKSNKTTRYEEDKRTLRSASRAEESILRHRQEPKENTVMTPRSVLTFSDDEEKTTPYQQKRAPQSRHGGGDKINHTAARNIEQKGKIVKEAPTTSFTDFAGSCMKYLVLALLALLVGTAAVFYISPETVLEVLGQGKFLLRTQVKKDLKGDFENLTSVFTNQSPLLWNRSRRILELHLDKWNNNAEPAIILLTGALDAEQTLLCLGTQLADIYSSSLSGNYTVISGSDWASGSNEEVKEYIDRHLSTSFQATSRAAVLHHIERLPAGSLLILYKYCDHETAVFKNVMLLLTVLLDDATLEKDMSLPDLEEKVRAFLIHKLIDSNTKQSHDGMDEDKFSGVWSRISHVVLPVFPEKNILGQCLKNRN